MKELLGTTQRDRVTGFEGVVEAVTMYLTGCNQACLRPASPPGGTEFKDAVWLDEQRLDAVTTIPKVVLPDLPVPATTTAKPATGFGPMPPSRSGKTVQAG